ncbi:hypothetical protein KSS93_09990 [Pseudomonas xanthosomatis]|uniref:hypothetical protein n=1 Tax=Pseudomonas xanthosomatis TaxID=2842356 RepID=UPI001C3C76D0|nr:hypothetical protein [Pseudomonas xanthosomatis]QXH48213.1 hypothetical protein KSS93_09990 [Pseudomonas xanthosomatis]
MKTFANLTLYAPGIVLFDPQTLLAFLQRLGTGPSNVFELFINDQAIETRLSARGDLPAMQPARWMAPAAPVIAGKPALIEQTTTH